MLTQYELITISVNTHTSPSTYLRLIVTLIVFTSYFSTSHLLPEHKLFCSIKPALKYSIDLTNIQPIATHRPTDTHVKTHTDLYIFLKNNSSNAGSHSMANSIAHSKSHSIAHSMANSIALSIPLSIPLPIPLSKAHSSAIITA